MTDPTQIDDDPDLYAALQASTMLLKTLTRFAPGYWSTSIAEQIAANEAAMKGVENVTD